MKSLRVRILANGDSARWTSWPAKIAAVKAFYAPILDLQIDLLKTNFDNVPIISQPGQITTFGPNGPVDTNGSDLYVAADWRFKNIVPLGAGYDLCIFQCDPTGHPGIPGGIFVGWGQIDTFIRNETDHAYQMAANGVSRDLGNNAALILIHEISHALYFMLNRPDNTHRYFYAATPEKVLTELVFSPTIEELNQQIIELLRREITYLTEKLAALQAQKKSP